MKQAKPKQKVIKNAGTRKSAGTKRPVRRVTKKMRPTVSPGVEQQRALVMWEAFAYEVAVINAEIMQLTKSNDEHGRPPFLFTGKILADVLKAYKGGRIEKSVAHIAGCHPDTISEIKKKSPTFSAMVSHARTHIRNRAYDVLDEKLEMVKPHFESIIDKKGKEHIQWVQGHEPSDSIVQWVLTHQAPEEFGTIIDTDATDSVYHSNILEDQHAEVFIRLRSRLTRYAGPNTQITSKN